jgi:hypothetical protein
VSASFRLWPTTLSDTDAHRRRDREGVTVTIDILAWHKPVDMSEVKHALAIERELGRERALDGERVLDGELILEESRSLEPASDLGHRSQSDELLLQPGRKIDRG